MDLLSYVVSNMNWILDRLTSAFREFKVEDTIVVSGVPRSGTTWLMEILETLPGYSLFLSHSTPFGIQSSER